MFKAKPALLLAVAASVVLSGCASNDGNLLNLRASARGPDEFSVLPSRPLTLPQNYAALPAPTPGGGNMTDPNPQADAIVALGGNARYLSTQGIPASDAAIVARASRYGVSSDIRTVLASEDAVFRKKNRGKILERMAGVTVYFKAYKKLALDSYAELDRLRRLGIRTPAAPPQGSQ